MEQTVNLFTKGLQMDTNPMIQGSDTLTDALNATLVTMNGNEVILQNDMGNRRVDNAFLPPGYEPVGMKEYGGVIYVASYNPVTHRSQIGSFPSPERKLDVENPDTDYGTGIFDFRVEGGYLTETTKLIPLTEDKVLHAGDKFMIYGQNLNPNEITNWDNVDGKKAISPKNKKYTLSIGVLNSQNEFVDITKDLARIDNIESLGEDENDESIPNPNYGKIINFEENDSEIYKFNRGYFLKNNAENNDTFTNTISDNNLILERQRLEANTYSYKLVGPLYLKVQYNIPTTFNYNIYGVKNTDDTEITIEGYFTYNCPDGVEDSLTPGNENYKTFDTGQIKKRTQIGEDENDNPIYSYNFCNFKFEPEGISLVEGSNDDKTDKYEETSMEFGNSSYDPVSNLYSVKITKHYKVYKTDGILTYDIKVGVLHTLEYIKSLSIENETLDLNKLNSGEVELTAWRFFNDFENLNTTLTYSFKAYPKYGYVYSGLVFGFRDITDTNELTGLDENPGYTDIITWLDTNKISHFNNPKPLNNGRTTINFNWSELGLNPRKIYKVEWGFKKENKYFQNEWDWNDDNRWFITTELYNNHYSVYSEEFWDDYCYYIDDNLELKFRKIDLNIPINIEKHIEDHSTLSEPEYENSMFGPEELIKFSCKYTYNLNIIDKSLYYIKDINLYPDFILLKSGIYPKIDSENTGIIAVGNYILQSGDLIPNIFNARVEKYLSSTFTGLNLDTFLDNPNISCLDKSITGTINYYDRYRSEGEIISKISNAFAKVGDVADLLFEISNNGACGIFADGCAEDGSRDEHYLHVFSGLTVDHDVRNELNNNGQINHHIDNSSSEPSNHSYLPEGANRIRERSHEGTVIFKVRDDEEQIFSYFNNDLNKDLIITYMFPLLFNNANDSDSTHTAPDKLEYYKRDSTKRERPSNSPVVGEYSRCWWRTNDGSWALVNELIPKLLNIVTYLEDLAYIAAHDISFNTNETVVITRALDVQQNERLPINIIITCPYSVVDINNFKKYININVKYGAFYHITGTNLIHFEIENTTKLIVITLLPGLYKNGSGEINRKQILSFELKNIIFTENSTNSNIMESTLPLQFTSLLSNQEEYSIYTNMFNENYYYCAYNEYNYSSDGKYLPIYKSSDKKTYNEKINDSLLLSIKYTKENSNTIPPVLPISPTGSLNYMEMAEIEHLMVITQPETVTPSNTETRGLRSNIIYTDYLQTIDNYNNISNFVNVKIQSNNIEDTQGIWINLVSGQDFRDKIMQDINPSNIILDTGEMLDSSGKELNLNYLYYRSGGKLISKPTKSVFIDRENTKATVNGDLNLLLYNRINRTLPLYRYNAIWELQEHTFTLLDFSGLNIVEKI